MRKLLQVLSDITQDFDFKIERNDDELTVSIDGIGSATGEYADIDEDTAKEYPPLGLEAYGDEAADEIYQQIDDIEHIFYIQEIIIDPSVRKKGYGKILLEKLETEAGKDIDALMGNASPFGHGSDRVSFSVLKKFYTKMGYKFLHIYDGSNGLIFKKV